MTKLIADAAPIVEGQPVGVDSHAVCTHCGKTLSEGDQVAVYLYSPADADRWDVGMIQCDGAWDHSPAETLGVAEVWATARLATMADTATQSARLVLHAPDVLEVSDPQPSDPK